MLTKDYNKIVAQLLAGNSEYTPKFLYLEFANSETEVSVPEDTELGREYYDSMLPEGAGYLRIPITITPTVDPVNSRIVYTVLVTTTESVNGIRFSSADHSRIYGVALAAAPVLDDPTQDVIFAREYFNGTKQLTMVDNQTFCFSFQLLISKGSESSNELEWQTS